MCGHREDIYFRQVGFIWVCATRFLVEESRTGRWKSDARGKRAPREIFLGEIAVDIDCLSFVTAEEERWLKILSYHSTIVGAAPLFVGACSFSCSMT